MRKPASLLLIFTMALSTSLSAGAQEQAQIGEPVKSQPDEKPGLTEPLAIASGIAVSEEGAAIKAARGEIFELDRQILMECIKMARFSLHYHQEVNRTGFWRSWIYPLEQETGTSLSYINTLTDLNQKAIGLTNTDRISRPTQKRVLKCAMVGQSITATSSTIELLHNGYIAWRAAKMGFSPKKSQQFVANSLKTIDSLLERRQSILSRHKELEDRRYLALQGKLLRHIRNQILYGFKQWSVSSRETEWSENIFYAIDAAQASTQLTSSILSNNAFRNSRLTGPAAITVLTANSMVAVNPILRTLIGKAVARRQARHLDRLFPQEKPRTMEELVRDWQELDEVMSGDASASKDSAVLKQVSFLSSQSQTMDNELDLETRKIARLRRVADQQAVAGPIIGMLSVARSTCAVISYYNFRGDKLAANAINFAGRISQTVGQSYSLYATPRAKVRSILYTRQLKKQGKLPEQLYKKRLQLLDDLEEQVKLARLN